MITATVWILLSVQNGYGHTVNSISMHPTYEACNEIKSDLENTFKFSIPSYKCVKTEVALGAGK